MPYIDPVLDPMFSSPKPKTIHPFVFLGVALLGALIAVVMIDSREGAEVFRKRHVTSDNDVR